MLRLSRLPPIPLSMLALACLVLACRWADAQTPRVRPAFPTEVAPAEPLYHETLRPQFHFTARYWNGYTVEPGNNGSEGWINDVNGPIWFDGEYHVFGQRWWHAWLHAVSKDLVHWTELKPAFGEGGKFGGTQSGTCVVDYHNASGLANGKAPVLIAFWAAQDNQNQCISFSNDRGRTWTKWGKKPRSCTSLPRPQGLLARTDEEVDHAALRAAGLFLSDLHFPRSAALGEAKQHSGHVRMSGLVSASA